MLDHVFWVFGFLGFIFFPIIYGFSIISQVLISVLLLNVVNSKEWVEDKNGYIAYCPCMGRFGNQAEMFLGALAFAKSLGRTILLPPWVEYNHPKNNGHPPFNTYFRLDTINEYTKAMLMEDFMEHLAPTVWPEDKRVVTCYSARKGDSCNAKDGNPFGPFWDNFNIDFVGSSFFKDLSWLSEVNGWKSRFPVSKFKVIAFTGTPGNFPVNRDNVKLHRFLKWSPKMKQIRDAFVRTHLKATPVLAVHFRHGSDWVCTHLSTRHLFASAQCLGYDHQRGQLDMAVCNPTDKEMLAQIKKAAKRLKVNTIFVAADTDHMIKKIQKLVGKDVKVLYNENGSPHSDLAILATADHYIGNCVSTFAAFVVRERRINNKSVEFWGRSHRADKENAHDEL